MALNSSLGATEIAQPAKCLPRKREKQRWLPSPHIKKKKKPGLSLYTCNPGARETDGKLSLANSASWIGGVSVQWQILPQKGPWKSDRGRYKTKLWRPFALTHTLTHTPSMHTCTHARIHTKAIGFQELGRPHWASCFITLYPSPSRQGLPLNLELSGSWWSPAFLVPLPSTELGWQSQKQPRPTSLFRMGAGDLDSGRTSLCIPLALEDGSWKRGLSWTWWLTLLILVPQRLRRAIATHSKPDRARQWVSDDPDLVWERLAPKRMETKISGLVLP